MSVPPSRADELRERLVSGAAWEAFCDRLKAMGREVLREDVPGSPLERAEGFRHLTRTLVSALQQVVEFSDVARPVLYQNPAPALKWGGDNPDNLYLHAAIDGARSYRLSGERGSAHDFILSTTAAGPMEAAATGDFKDKDHLVFAERSARDLRIGPDGRFTVWISPEEPEGRPGDWLPSHPDVGFLLIRQYFADWAVEEGARFVLVCEEAEGTAPEPLDPGRLAAMLDDAATWIERMPFWTRMIQRSHAACGDNALAHFGSVRGGASDISYGQGFFALDEGEALLVETEPPRARYWQFALGNHWFESLDFANHQSSLNGQQIRVDADGRARLVIARRDPGVPNWLDTAGHARGLIQYRWVWTETDPRPSARVVPFASLADVLPPDTPRVTPAQRRETIRMRQAHVRRRHHWV